MNKPSMKKLKIAARKKGPAVGIAVGIGVGIAAAVIGCMRSRKYDSEMEPINEEIEDAKEEIEDSEEGSETEKEAKKKLRRARIRKVVRTCRIFAIPVLLGFLSVGMIVGSYKVVAAELLSASTFARKLDDEFKSYRKAVREKYGAEVDKDLHIAGITKGEKDVTSVDENGTVHTEKRKVIDGEAAKHFSPYAIPFCATYCGSAFKDNEYYDTLTINSAIQSLQLSMARDGMAFVDEAHKEFNYDITPDSKRGGWIRKKGEDPNVALIQYTVTPYVFRFNEDEDGNPIEENGYIIDFPNARDILDEIPRPSKKVLPPHAKRGGRR